MPKNKRELFMRNRQDLAVDGDWESIADEISKERDFLKEEINKIMDDSKSNDIINVDPSLCGNWAYSDRSDFEIGDIDALSEDIKKNGQLQPVIIRRIRAADEGYEVIAGERRWRACLVAGISLKAIVTEGDDSECLVMQTSENKKESLSPYSLAKVYLRMMKDKSMSQNKMADLLNIPGTSFRNILSFNNVPKEIWDNVKDMSKVKPRTADYISKICSKGDEYIIAIKNLSEHIREGRGEDFLSGKIDKCFNNKKTKRNGSSIYKGTDGQVLFRVTEAGSIKLSDYLISKLSIEEISKKIVDALK